MSKRIYIGNLPWSVTKVKLEELFRIFGSMEDALVISDTYTGRSRGFGFVTYKNNSDADKAIAEMNEKEVEGRKLVVREARPMGEQGEKKPQEEKKPSSKKSKKTTKKIKKRGIE